MQYFSVYWFVRTRMYLKVFVILVESDSLPAQQNYNF